MKKVYQIVAVLLAVLMLSACNSGTPKGNSTTQGSAPNNSGTAGSYPTKPITLIVPWAVGGASDNVSRIIATLMSKDLGQTIVVVNKEGASSAVGLKELAASKPDGYTIGLATSSITLNAHSGIKDALNNSSFAPIAMFMTSPGCIAVSTKSQFKTLKDFLDYSKANPGKVKLADNGATSIWRLFNMKVAEASGTKFAFVPYDGSADIIAALMGGHIDSASQSSASLSNNVKSGDLRFLAVASDERSPFFPDVPTFKEQGIDFTLGLWTGLLAPKGTDPAIVQKLTDSLKKALDSSVLKDFLNNSGQTTAYMNPKDFAAFLDQFDVMIGKLAKEAGLEK